MIITAENVEAAAELLAKPNKWIKDSYGDGKGHYCAVGALAHVILGSAYSVHRRELENEADYLFKRAGVVSNSASHIAWWNDSGNRTKAQVLDGFERVAKFLRNEGK